MANSTVERLAEVIAANFDNEFDDDRHGYWTASAVGGLARFEFIPAIRADGTIPESAREVYDVEVTRVDKGNV